jgi:hypothetical protein
VRSVPCPILSGFLDNETCDVAKSGVVESSFAQRGEHTADNFAPTNGFATRSEITRTVQAGFNRCAARSRAENSACLSKNV